MSSLRPASAEDEPHAGVNGEAEQAQGAEAEYPEAIFDDVHCRLDEAVDDAQQDIRPGEADRQFVGCLEIYQREYGCKVLRRLLLLRSIRFSSSTRNRLALLNLEIVLP